MSRRAARAGALAPLALPAAAWAHGEIKGIGAFYSGLLHPFVSPSHLIALLALGLLFGQRGVPASRHAMAALMAALAAGLGFSGRAGGLEPELPLLALAALLGGTVVAARQWPALALGLLSLLVGLAVGLGSAPDGMGGSQRWSALLGTMIGASLCTACVAGLVHGARRPWARIGVRVVGSWLTASAILVLTLTAVRA
ncbi:HupE/UreJ family protein [Aquincola sp. MAHUQ-54]|uniref:HupE/UreJ family protein n=1 Tax=Aquincola agrisoli TaxID=3119538 RepID=A0AAW9Q973_9BURK